jgi:hypothetical protein
MAGLTPFGKLMKWVLAPLALAALGYLVIGPRIGRSATGEKAGEQIRSAIQRDIEHTGAAQPAQTASNEPATGAHSGPSFDVSVLPVSEPPPQVPHRRRRRHKPAAPVTAPATTAPETPTPAIETPDPASTNGGETGTTGG